MDVWFDRLTENTENGVYHKLEFENNVEKLACVKCDYKETQTDKNVTSATRASESVIGVFKP